VAERGSRERERKACVDPAMETHSLPGPSRRDFFRALLLRTRHGTRLALRGRDMRPLRNVAPVSSLPSTDRTRCIVVESGGSTPAPTSEGFDETIVVTQTVGEPPEVFAQRTLARLASVGKSARHVESLTLLTGDRDDGCARAARRLIVQSLAAQARANRGCCELLLSASSKVGPETRAELLGIIEEVLAASNGRSAPVRLVFETEPPPARRSGVFPVFTPPHEHQAQQNVR
jgi:hypothetical protein